MAMTPPPVFPLTDQNIANRSSQKLRRRKPFRMDPAGPIRPDPSAEAVRARQDAAISRLGDGQAVTVCTSPRLLRELLQGQLLATQFGGCESVHELFLLPNQTSGKDTGGHFISCVCSSCRCHFRIKCSTSDSQQWPGNHREGMHMFVLGDEVVDVDPDGVQKKTIDMTCIVDECSCHVEVSMLPPVITNEYVQKMRDPSRVRRHLRAAREQYPDRYPKADEAYDNVITNLLQYTRDNLNQNPGQVRRIKTRNKIFVVCFNDDFDGFLRGLNFQKGILDDEDTWTFPALELRENTTPVGSLRAKWEDVEAELLVLNRRQEELRNAWTDLQSVFGTYPSVNVVRHIPADALNVLGCLEDYRPRTFSWAATLLSDKCSARRSQFLMAAQRCGLDRDENAEMEIVLYNSQFDSHTRPDPQLAEAFDFFHAKTAEERSDPVFFLNQYYSYAQRHQTDQSRALAQQHLEVISTHLKRDIVGQIDPQVLENMGATAVIGDGRMTVPEAAKFLEIEPNYTAEIIQDIVNNLAQDPRVDRPKAAEALQVLAEWRRRDLQDSSQKEAAALETMAAIFTGNTGAGYSLNASDANQPDEEQGPLATPPGLRNIGNTCYLNSLLQYFYNVNPIRDGIMKYDELKLDLDEKAIAARRTGGSGMPVEMEEAIVARQFTEMLRDLFVDLGTTNETAAEPSQKLANTALSSARTLLKDESPGNPPPLPARPSPFPPAPSAPSHKDEDSDMVNVTVEPIHDGLETSSAVSSQTLINETDGPSAESYVAVNLVDGAAQCQDPEIADATHEMTDANLISDNQPVSKVSSLHEKIQEVSQRLEHSDRKGTDQQDVEEVIGFILEHLMRAVKPTGPFGGIEGLQSDLITDTFFPIVVNYTQKVVDDETLPNKEVVADRFITAFPDPSPGISRPLLQALDEHFDVQFMEGDYARYTAIRSLPPILHIRIQRTGQTKNMNPVVLEDILYMDRYMEAKPEDDLYTERRRAWANRELREELALRTREDAAYSIKPRAAAQTSQYHDIPTEQGNGAESQQVQLPASSTSNKQPSLINLLEDDAEFDPLLADWDIVTDTVSAGKIAGTEAVDKTPIFAAADESSTMTDSGPSGANSSSTSGFAQKLCEITGDYVAVTQDDLKQLHTKEDETFAQFRKHKYRLHAVICHSGGSSAGHYWIWVHDFKKNVWLKYNDSMVTEDARDSSAVLNQLSQNGDPYYLAYVRDDRKEELVAVPERAARPVVEHTESMCVETIEGVDPNLQLPNGAMHQSSVNSGPMDIDDAPPPYEIS